MWWFSTIQSCFIDIPLTTSPPLIIISGSVPYPIPSKEPAQAEIFVIRPWMNILSWWMRRDAQKPDTFIVDVLTPVCDQTNQSWLDSVPSCISCLRVVQWVAQALKVTFLPTLFLYLFFAFFNNWLYENLLHIFLFLHNKETGEQDAECL